MNTPFINNPISRLPLRCGFLLVTLTLACFTPTAQAVLPPPTPDGGYPGANTAEGQGALQGLTTGIHNTALGYQTLFSNTTGHDNTGSGFGALDLVIRASRFSHCSVLTFLDRSGPKENYQGGKTGGGHNTPWLPEERLSRN